MDSSCAYNREKRMDVPLSHRPIYAAIRADSDSYPCHQERNPLCHHADVMLVRHIR